MAVGHPEPTTCGPVRHRGRPALTEGEDANDGLEPRIWAQDAVAIDIVSMISPCSYYSPRQTEVVSSARRQDGLVFTYHCPCLAAGWIGEEADNSV